MRFILLLLLAALVFPANAKFKYEQQESDSPKIKVVSKPKESSLKDTTSEELVTKKKEIKPSTVVRKVLSDEQRIDSYKKRKAEIFEDKEEINAAIEKKLKPAPTKPAKVVPVKLNFKKGDTLEKVVEHWASDKGYVVHWELGEWVRVKMITFNTSSYFSSSFIESITALINHLNQSRELKINDLILVVDIYQKNKTIVIKPKKGGFK